MHRWKVGLNLPCHRVCADAFPPPHFIQKASVVIHDTILPLPPNAKLYALCSIIYLLSICIYPLFFHSMSALKN